MLGTVWWLTKPSSTSSRSAVGDSDVFYSGLPLGDDDVLFNGNARDALKAPGFRLPIPVTEISWRDPVKVERRSLKLRIKLIKIA